MANGTKFFYILQLLNFHKKLKQFLRKCKLII